MAEENTPAESDTPVLDSVMVTPEETPESAADGEEVAEETVPVADAPPEVIPMEDRPSAVAESPELNKMVYVGPVVPSDTAPHPSVHPAQHHVDVVKAALTPADDGYNPDRDPLIPTSTIAETIATEIKGFGHSPMWTALRAEFEKEWSHLF